MKNAKKLQAVLGIAALALIVQTAEAQPLVTFTEDSSGDLTITEFGIDANPFDFSVHLENLSGEWTIRGATADSHIKGQGPATFNPLNDIPIVVGDVTQTIFWGDYSLGSGGLGKEVVVDLDAVSDTLSTGDAFTVSLDGYGTGLDYAFLGFPLPLINPANPGDPVTISGTIVYEVTAVGSNNISFKVTDGTGGLLVQSLNYYDNAFGGGNGIIDGPFTVDQNGGTYVPAPPPLALLGFGLLLPLLRRRAA